MPVADVIASLAAARFQANYFTERVWPGLVADLSAELPYGDALDLPTDDLTVSIDSETQANIQGDALANHQWPNPHIGDPTQVTLNMDQYFRINEGIPTAHQRQVRPDMVNSKMMTSARRAAERINSYIRSRVQALADDDQLLTGISVTAANVVTPNDTFLSHVRRAFFEAEEELDYEHMPPEGRVAVVSPTIHSVIERFYEDAKIPYQTVINDQITAQGVMLRLSGFNIVKDASPGPGKASGDDAKHTMFFFRRGEGISYGEQINQLTAIDGMQSGSDFDGWLVRGRFLYGASVNQPNKVRLTKINIT